MPHLFSVNRRAFDVVSIFRHYLSRGFTPGRSTRMRHYPYRASEASAAPTGERSEPPCTEAQCAEALTA